MILSSFAFADALAAPEPCESSQIQATSPAPLAEDVPVDAVPAGLLTSSNCGSATWSAELSIPATGEVVVSVTQAADAGRVIEVDPGADLLPDTDYRLSFTVLDGDGVASEIGFSTGSGESVGLDGGPMVQSASVSWSREGSTFVNANLQAAPSSDGDTFIALAIEGDDPLAVTTAAGAAEVFLSGFTSFAEAPDEVCVVARQRDIAGVWSESPPDCVAPEIEGPLGGCSTAPPAFGAFGVLLALLSVRRARS